MIDGYPDDEQLSAPDQIILVDESMPEWRLPIYSGQTDKKKFVSILQIKIHAHSPGIIRSWRERVLAVRGNSTSAIQE